MAVLAVHRNSAPGGGPESAVLTADGAVVGEIGLAGPDVYAVNTRGRIPAIDGIKGSSAEDAWKAVIARVKQGGVHLVEPITI